jgi:hypothetical protein
MTGGVYLGISHEFAVHNTAAKHFEPTTFPLDLNLKRWVCEWKIGIYPSTTDALAEEIIDLVMIMLSYQCFTGEFQVVKNHIGIGTHRKYLNCFHLVEDRVVC